MKKYEKEILETYFNDLYSMFVKRLADFATNTSYVDKKDNARLIAILEELIKIKSIQIK